MFLTSDLIKTKHGFFTREGGVSTGDFESLNCGYGSGDDEEKVDRNRKIVTERLHCSEVITAKQTHSDVALVVNGPGKYQADALVTDKFGLAIGVLTADCVPVLLYSEKSAVIAAVHAGWRGARFGIIGSTIRAMQNLGAEDIVAVIGPCIQQSSYEVGPEFLGVFGTEAPTNTQFFTPSKNEGHHMFDLPGYVEMKLYKNGVFKVKNLTEDTYSKPDVFFSYRRNSQQGIKHYGRQLSVISL